MLSKKHSFIISGLIMLIIIIVGCSSNSEGAGSDGNGQIKLRIATWHPSESDATKEYLKPFMEKVTSDSDGRVQFEFYPGEQLGKAADALSLVDSGVADISHFSPSFTPSETALSAIIPGIPGLYDSTVVGGQAFYKIAQQSPVLEKDYLNNGVRPISMALTPFYDVFNNKKPIKVPEDIDGLKIRAAGGIFTTILDNLGATPVQISTGDIYSGYSAGVIDGLHFSASNMGTFSLEELTKYGTPDLNLGSGIHGLIINEELFQSLPKDIQDIIMQVGEEMGRKYTGFDDSKNKQVFDEFAKSEDLTLHELSENDKVKWQKFYDKFKKDVLKEQDNEEFNKAIDMFLKELEKHK